MKIIEHVVFLRVLENCEGKFIKYLTFVFLYLLCRTLNFYPGERLRPLALGRTRGGSGPTPPSSWRGGGGPPKKIHDIEITSKQRYRKTTFSVVQRKYFD